MPDMWNSSWRERTGMILAIMIFGPLLFMGKLLDRIRKIRHDVGRKQELFE